MSDFLFFGPKGGEGGTGDSQNQNIQNTIT